MSTQTGITFALIFATAAWYYSSKYGISQGPLTLGLLEYRLHSGHVRLFDEKYNTVIEWTEDFPSGNGLLYPCAKQATLHSHCMRKTGSVELELKHDTDKESECYGVKYTPLLETVVPAVCFYLSDAHWYGGAEVFRQLWPMNKQEIPMQPFLSNDVGLTDLQQWGSILERYWVSSKGVGITVHRDVPLHVSFNVNGNNKMCFKADYSEDPYNSSTEMFPVLDFTVCRSKVGNVKSIHKFLYKKHFPLPKSLPDIRMIRSPVWSTWARYKVHINQTKTLQFAQEIVDNGFSNSQIEIDDMYSSSYGEIDFNSEKFPDPKEMVRNLHNMGFRVTVWVHPFANVDSAAFVEGTQKGYWVMDKTGNVPGLVRWWQGIGGVLDVTNKEAVDWYTGRLRSLQQTYGVHSFKFDAGENQYLPPNFRTKVPLSSPSDYTTLYARAVAALGSQIEVRVGYQSQDLPVFVRMFDKFSRWDYENGLKTMIPTSLAMGLLGYHFILPDMIGGNAYDENDMSETIMPDRELFIRWAQLNAYLPAMQFSIAPWQYDVEVTRISREMVKIHEEVVTPLVIEAAKEAMQEGTPIIRPLWWISPNDQDSLTCDSEFLVGDSLLVAPILDKGARKRDVYLPAGRWRDELRQEVSVGPAWLRDYKIELNEIATFRKL